MDASTISRPEPLGGNQSVNPTRDVSTTSRTGQSPRARDRIRLLQTDEGWSVSCLDFPGCHSQGDSREEALANIREAIALWLEVEAEEAGVKPVETLELAI
ncbi:MAG: type II toxin-antitoxin system HicB family antitoxin [Cyanobium sp.]